MTAHYLVDMFGNPVTTAGIVDVREPNNGQSLANGCFVVRVPDFIQVQKPTDLSDLITKKYQGMLGFYAGFTYIAYDDLLDDADVDTGYAGTVGFFGQRGSIAILPGGYLQTTMVPLSSTPTVGVITWEVFDFVDSDPKTDRFQRTYRERPSTSSYTTCQVSFDNGVHFNATTDGSVFNVPLAHQGNQFIMRLRNTSSQTLHIGSWAVVY